MNQALKEAQKAFEKDEVPVGVVVVCTNRIIARSYNLTETLVDVTAHAEVQAITIAANSIGGKYLDECTFYVTVEPCVMCAGALFWAQAGRIVFGASDEKRGFSKYSGAILHPRTEIAKSVLENDCSLLMKRFFAEKRMDQ